MYQSVIVAPIASVVSMAPHLFKVRWKEPNELLKPTSSPCTPPPSSSQYDSYPDPDPDPVLPCIQIRPTRQNQLSGIPTYSRLGCHQVILGPQDVLVPAPPRQPHSRCSAPQSNTVKAQALSLLYCTQSPRTREKYKVVSEITHLSISVLYRLVKKAKAMGYDSEHDLQIEEEYIAPIKPLGPKRTATSKAMEDKVIALIEKNRNGREKSSEVLGFQLGGISHMSILRMLKRRGYHARKPTWKPILNHDQKEARLQFALRHRHWTLEDWKAVIWSD